MEHYAGIDVSLELSSICLVDVKGKITASGSGQVERASAE
jgi:hypothetical protein